MRAVFFFLLLIVLSFNANALSVVSDYLENNTIYLKDGTSKLYGIRLQNPDQEETQLQLVYDDAIAKVIDYKEAYMVPPKSSIAIVFNVSAPKKSKPGDIYTISYTVHQLAGSGPGVPILLRIGNGFKVKIIKDPDRSHINYAYVAYGTVALALLLYLFSKAISGYWKRRSKIPGRISKKGKIIK